MLDFLLSRETKRSNRQRQVGSKRKANDKSNSHSRYSSQGQILEVASEYVRRGLPISVIVVDYHHWVHEGDWRFSDDPEVPHHTTGCWPNPTAMAEQLATMGEPRPLADDASGLRFDDTAGGCRHQVRSVGVAGRRDSVDQLRQHELARPAHPRPGRPEQALRPGPKSLTQRGEFRPALRPQSDSKTGVCQPGEVLH